MKTAKKRVPELRFKGFDGDWEQRKLSELGILGRGKSKHRPRNDPKLFGGAYPFVQTGDVSSSGLYLNNFTQTLSEFGLAQSKLWGKGTLAITIAANVADSTILAIDAAFPDSVIGFSAKGSSVVFDKFLLDKLSSELKRTAPTGSQANLNLEILSSTSEYAPSISEQDKIANLLIQFENNIALHERKLELLKKLKQAYLQQLLPKGERKTPRLRFDGFTNSWDQCELGDIFSEYSKKSSVENEKPIFSSTNKGIEVRVGRVSGTSNVGYKIIDNGDLVLSPQNLWLGNININTAGAGLVSPSYKTFKITGAQSSFINPQLRRPQMLFAYKNASTQGASIVRRNLDMDAFNKISIRIPSEPEQILIGQLFKNLDNATVLHQRKLSQLKKLEQSFLQKLFV